MADSQALGRTISHGFVQRPLEVPDELTFPQLTERGPHTDAYLEETPSGLVLAREAEAGQVYPTPSKRASRQSTLVSPHAAGGGGGEKLPPTATKPEAEAVDDTKLVTWLVDDPQNPRNWSHTKKWYVPRPLDAVPFVFRYHLLTASRSSPLRRVQTIIPTIYCFIAGFASSLITGGMPEQAEYFGIGELVMNLVIVRLCPASDLPVRSTELISFIWVHSASLSSVSVSVPSSWHLSPRCTVAGSSTSFRCSSTSS